MSYFGVGVALYGIVFFLLFSIIFLTVGIILISDNKKDARLGRPKKPACKTAGVVFAMAGAFFIVVSLISTAAILFSNQCKPVDTYYTTEDIPVVSEEYTQQSEEEASWTSDVETSSETLLSDEEYEPALKKHKDETNAYIDEYGDNIENYEDEIEAFIDEYGDSIESYEDVIEEYIDEYGDRIEDYLDGLF